MSVATRYAGIDAFRYIAFIFIVILHCLPSTSTSAFVAPISHLTRFAVPFFFISSGYFLGRSDPDLWPGLVKLFKRLAPVFIFWIAVYAIISRNFESFIHIKSLLRILFTGGQTFHLWFLPALGISSPLLLVLKRYSWNILFFVAVVLYITGLTWGAYRSALGLPDIPINIRNGPVMGFPFILAGYYIFKRGIKLDMKQGLAIAGLGYAVQLIEAVIIGSITGRNIGVFDFSVGTYLFGIGMFFVALNLKSRPFVGGLAKLGLASLGMYCAHILFIRLAYNYLESDILWQNIYLVMFTIVASTLLSMLLYKIPYLKKVVS